MTVLSPTQITTYCQHCPGALRFYRDRRGQADDSGELAGVGSAAHFVLHRAALHCKGGGRGDGETLAVVMELAAVALAARGHPDRVWEGYRIASEFVLSDRWDRLFSPDLDYEYGAAFTRDWARIAYNDPEAYLRLIFDVCGVIDEDQGEDGSQVVAIGRDYKTGWHVDESDLESPQALAYSTALRTLYGACGDIDAIRLEWLGIRPQAQRTVTRTWQLSSQEDQDDLDRRQAKLEFLIAAVLASRLETAPGPGCRTCDYQGRCEAFSSLVAASCFSPEVPTGDDLAVEYAAVDARREVLVAALRRETKESGPIVVTHESGETSALGWHRKTRLSFPRPEDLADLWIGASKLSDVPDDYLAAVRGLLKALAPSVTSAKAALGTLAGRLGYPSKRAAVEDLGARLFTEGEVFAFGWADEE